MSRVITQSEQAACDSLLEWLDDQPDVDWVICTLKTDGNLYRGMLQEVMKKTLRVFEYHVLGRHAVKRHRDYLRRLPVFGGETFLHYHLMLEYRPGRHMLSPNEFALAFKKEWQKQLGKIGHRGDVAQRKDEIMEFHRSLHRRRHAFAEYILRYEGSRLGYGVNKVDITNMHLDATGKRPQKSKVAS